MTSPYLDRPLRTYKQALLDQAIAQAKTEEPAKPDQGRYSVDLYGPPVRLWDEGW